jgi:hypothetical protein
MTANVPAAFDRHPAASLIGLETQKRFNASHCEGAHVITSCIREHYAKKKIEYFGHYYAPLAVSRMSACRDCRYSAIWQTMFVIVVLNGVLTAVGKSIAKYTNFNSNSCNNDTYGPRSDYVPPWQYVRQPN